MTRFTKTDLELKYLLLQKCRDFVEHRLKMVQQTIFEIQESLNSETKSSAGDKHETGRAMLQLEREKVGHQLSEIEKLKEALNKININQSLQTVGLGSLVLTDSNNYFISISAGKFSVDGNDYFALSPNTPIGKLLIGKQPTDKIIFRNSSFSIQRIL